MVKNTFRLVFIYSIIIGIAGAIASTFIHGGLLVFSVVDQMFINYDSSAGAYVTENNYVVITIVKIIMSILLLVLLGVVISKIAGAVIVNPVSMLAFTGKSGFNAVNRTTRGLGGAVRDGFGGAMNAVRGIRSGDPASLYKSARYADLMLGRRNTLSRILNTGAEINQFRNLDGNKGEVKDDAESNKKGKLRVKDKDELLEGMLMGKRPQQRYRLNQIKKDEKARLANLEDLLNNTEDPREIERLAAAIAEAKDNIAQADYGLVHDMSRERRDKANEFINAYNDAHKNHEVGEHEDKLPGEGNRSNTMVNSNVTQNLNHSETPDMKETNADGERAMDIGTQQNAQDMEEKSVEAEIAKEAGRIGNPATHAAGLPAGETDEVERAQIVERVHSNGRAIPSDIMSGVEALENGSIYGSHLSTRSHLDSNANPQQIKEAHINSSEQYAEGMVDGAVRDYLNEDNIEVRKSIRDKQGLFTIDNDRFREIMSENDIDGVDFYDQDEMVATAGSVMVYENENGQKAIRFNEVLVDTESGDQVIVRDMDVMLDDNAQEQIQQYNLSNEQIVQGFAEGKFNGAMSPAGANVNGEQNLQPEQVSFIDQIRQEVEAQRLETQQVPQGQPAGSSQVTAPGTVAPTAIPQQRIEVTPMTVQSANQTAQVLNTIAGNDVAHIDNHGNMQVSLTPETIDRLVSQRSEGSFASAGLPEDATRFVNGLLNSMISNRDAGDTVRGNVTNYTTNNEFEENHSTFYRNGDNVKVQYNPTTGQQIVTRTPAENASEVDIDSLQEEARRAAAAQNERRLDEMMERADRSNINKGNNINDGTR